MAPKVYNFHAVDATREAILLRAALCGPTGSGKTTTALILATRMVERMGLGPVYFVDAESGSGLRYAYSPRSKQGFRFKHVPMPQDDFSPAAYTAVLDYCEAEGAGVIIVDSFSHAWAGINGVLEQVDTVTEKSRSKNTFGEGWKAMTPVHNRLIQRILSSSAHVIFTLRSKAEWVLQENARGKIEPIKVGTAPIQREGVDYEPDLFFDMAAPSNVLTVTKSRCYSLPQGETFAKPGPDFADVIIDWIKDAEPAHTARTLGEAISIAVAEGVLAAEEKSPEKYKAARRKLVEWCQASGVALPRMEMAALQFKDRVAVVTGPKQPAKTEAPAVAPLDGEAPITKADVQERIEAANDGRQPGEDE